MIKTLRPVIVAAAAALSLNAYADIGQFLLLSDVDGESQDPTYTDSIDVLAWTWNVSQSGTIVGGPGQPSFADIALTKYVDTSSTELYRHVADGTMFDNAILKNQITGNNPFVAQEIVMYEVLVTSASTGGSGGEDRLTESITLNFNSFCIKYTQDIDSPTTEFCWNITGGEPCTTGQLESLVRLPLTLSLPMDSLLRVKPVCRST